LSPQSAGRNKTFWFLSAEGFRLRQSALHRHRFLMPSAAEDAHASDNPCVANFADNIMCTQGQISSGPQYPFYLSPSLSKLQGHHHIKWDFSSKSGRDNYAQSNVASAAF